MESKQETSDQDRKDSNTQEPAKEESSEQPVSFDNAAPSKAQQWFQDNLRIIVSVVIVILIAGGIYSYSKRGETQPSNSGVETTEQSQNTAQTNTGNSQNNTAANQTQNQGQTQTKPQDQAQPANQNAAADQSAPKTTSSVSTSQETSAAFVETAVRGDSETKLARRALADYLEKNTDSTLTAEHKIYIEDYLVKNIAPQRIYVGTSVEFSKGLIQQAIGAAKNLNSRQLQNLQKYAAAVPSLS
jgi:preprotein translocase subunit SecF